MFYLVPQAFNSIEFRTVGRKKIERQSLLFQELDQRLYVFRLMDRGVVQNEREWLSNRFHEQGEKATKCFRGRGLPQLRSNDLARGKHGGKHVEPLASSGFNQVTLPSWCPGTAIGVNLCKACLITVRQDDFPCCGLRSQDVDLSLGGSESLFISFF